MYPPPRRGFKQSLVDVNQPQTRNTKPARSLGMSGRPMASSTVAIAHVTDGVIGREQTTGLGRWRSHFGLAVGTLFLPLLSVHSL
eukprot:65655-Pyramimonas_sp.AAC.1